MLMPTLTKKENDVLKIALLTLKRVVSDDERAAYSSRCYRLQ